MQKKKLEIREGSQKQWRHTSTQQIFFFLSLDFSCELSERLPTFFLMPCQYFQNNECKKKLEIREGSQQQWKHTSTGQNFFFLSLDFPQEHSERFPTFFFMPCQYFQNNVCKKKTRNLKGKSRAMETHFYPIQICMFMKQT